MIRSNKDWVERKVVFDACKRDGVFEVVLDVKGIDKAGMKQLRKDMLEKCGMVLFDRVRAEDADGYAWFVKVDELERLDREYGRFGGIDHDWLLAAAVVGAVRDPMHYKCEWRDLRSDEEKGRNMGLLKGWRRGRRDLSAD